jgi:cytochrome o ubiquinol oxidase subunit 2
MRFKFHGKDQAGFDAWVKSVKAGAGGTLDRTVYQQLEQPSERDPVQRYSTVAGDLFDAIVGRCVAPGTVCMGHQMASDARRNAAGSIYLNDPAPRLVAAKAEEMCFTPTNSAKTTNVITR